jgi:hypothetical protein
MKNFRTIKPADKSIKKVNLFTDIRNSKIPICLIYLFTIPSEIEYKKGFLAND